MKYRAEIDGLRALAVLPVILFHAGFDLFSGGFVGVDVFFVISGYLITTILIEDIENKRFSIANFYERRARRILPALLFCLFVTTILSYYILFPSDLKDYSKSLLSVIIFSSNIYFWRVSDYFATEAEFTPLLHTWSLAVEEQYYLLFPIFLMLAWRFGKTRVFWMILILTVLSFLLSEWGWRNRIIANFFLAPTRAWELFAGSLAAFIVYKYGVRKNNLMSLVGLAAIMFSIFVYDERTPFPSFYTLVPVLGVVLLVLYAHKNTFVAKFLSTKVMVGIGLISYSSYLWHQPLFALTRREYGIELNPLIAMSLILITFILATLSWKFVESPFRNKSFLTRKAIFASSFLASATLFAIGAAILITNGASYRYDFPSKPKPWADINCHGAKQIEKYKNPIEECLGNGDSSSGGDIYLVGDSHAAQITFALSEVAKSRGVAFNFINTENKQDFPRSFWIKPTSSDRILDYLIEEMSEGDFLLVTFHRGRLNPQRDVHFSPRYLQARSERSDIFTKNMVNYTKRFEHKNIKLILVKDGPLLSDADTSLEGCMYKFINSKKSSCLISFSEDNNTRYLQSKSFSYISEKYDFVNTIDYLPELYQDGYFSPIDENGNYLMFDRHHLTQNASIRLVPFFAEKLK